ncbi:putative SOS response-associated peptidase yoqW [Geobacter sp. OR-1]|uniref:SOS response-associated peptidase n=1 Tax=Geobacter sp. OR-1 TaxID=1266765 RepID=UPI0005441CB5|nr:SOS response-associated peptidase [Geobacter sp. OR-1]GAM10381.1 putative SOS response-associated peptidase yoqW [Geobacter sp. OR-1]
MCGRFTSLLTPELLAVIYEIHAKIDLQPRYNIAPTQDILVVREDSAGVRYPSYVRWGLIPHWAKDKSIASKMINARSETVHEKPAFRQAIRSRRCIVPASGFFEWSATPTGKFPHYITMRDESPFSFAGIWETWKASDGSDAETCTILTTSANPLMATIHDRMPVILHQGEFRLWLDPTVNDPRELQRLYQPYPAELMQEWQVSTAVNSPRHSDPNCIVPT